ncbi:MAG: D-alanyl-D-alanine carboxypeptidase [Proteobacteria bacterium]|nr:D-alanyl-D-alanine carboxypeptidase [Pseudomonadota bacterium]
MIKFHCKKKYCLPLIYIVISIFFLFYSNIISASDKLPGFKNNTGYTGYKNKSNIAPKTRAVVAMDVSTGKILYAKNPDLKCFPASTTKLMTAIVSIENADLNRIVIVSKNASNVSPHRAGFKTGDKVTVEKLLYAALIGSANDAAVALAEGISGSVPEFVELMNKKAAEIGANNTRFINPNGLPGTGQYITASDLSKIMQYALRYPILKEIIGTRFAEISTLGGTPIFLKNTNKLLWSDEEIIGGKTGYTRRAGHCFVGAAERENDKIIVALLGSPSRKDLWKQSETLIEKGFEVKENGEEPLVYCTQTKSFLEKSSFGNSVKLKNNKKYSGKRSISRKSKKHKREQMLAKNNYINKNIANAKYNSVKIINSSASTKDEIKI